MENLPSSNRCNKSLGKLMSLLSISSINKTLGLSDGSKAVPSELKLIYLPISAKLSLSLSLSLASCKRPMAS
jgi:hypothetical protein